MADEEPSHALIDDAQVADQAEADPSGMAIKPRGIIFPQSAWGGDDKRHMASGAASVN